MRKSLILLVAAVVVFGLPVMSQTIDTIWTQTYTSGGHDSVNCLVQTADGGFIIAGYSKEYAVIETDIFLVKTDSDGNEEWSVNIGDENLETAYHILQTFDGGYLVSAQSDAFGSVLGDFRIWIVRTDENGDTLWTYPFTADNGNGFPLYAVQTSDSGFAITGIINVSYDNKAFILKLDKDGGYQWHSYYGDSFPQDGWYIAQLPDSGYMVTGNFRNTYSTDWDFWAFRTDKIGTLLWDSCYALTDYADYVYGGCLVDDGLAIVGLARGKGHVHKIDFDGHTLWSKSISILLANEKYTDICPTSDGGYMVGGWLGVAGHLRDFCYIKLDAAGDTMWSFTVGGGDYDHGRSVVETSDGGYALAGSSDSWDMYTCFYLTKIGLVTDVANPGPKDLPGAFHLSKNYPNPFNPTTTFSYSVPHRSEVSLTIYNVLGQRVKVLESGVKPAGDYRVQWDGTDDLGHHQPTGVYFCRLKAEGADVTQKMLLLK